jgi:hypothetical protein
MVDEVFCGYFTVRREGRSLMSSIHELPADIMWMILIKAARLEDATFRCYKGYCFNRLSANSGFGNNMRGRKCAQQMLYIFRHVCQRWRALITKRCQRYEDKDEDEAVWWIKYNVDTPP